MSHPVISSARWVRTSLAVAGLVLILHTPGAAQVPGWEAPTVRMKSAATERAGFAERLPARLRAWPASGWWQSGGVPAWREPVPLRAGGWRIPVPEQEPNDSPDTATPMAIGDDAFGRIDPAGDVDFFSLQLEAGVRVVFEVFASRTGSPLDSFIGLFAPDGVTVLAVNDDAVGTDSRLAHTPAVSGRYYVAIRDFFGRGGPDFVYQLSVREEPPPPGDPSTLFATGLGSAWRTVAAPGNVFYVADIDGRIVRVAAGQATTFASGLVVPIGIALDGHGEVLVAHGATGEVPGQARVTRITVAGQRTDIITGHHFIPSLALDSAGHIWLVDAGTAHIYRYTHEGVRLDSIPIAFGSVLMDLVFSPAGVLHFSDFTRSVFRLVGGQLERVIVAETTGGIAFDRDGYLYMGSAGDGVHLFDPVYQIVNSPFATDGLDLIGHVVFGRDAAGAMTNRLFTVDLETGTMRELNRAGVRAPGFRVGVDLLRITTQALRPAVMGAPYADTLTTDPPGATWRIVQGSLPPGLALSVAGVISGVPETSGAFALTVEALAAGRAGTRSFTLQVDRPVITAAAAADHLLGLTGALTPDQLRFLDLQGNRNGRYDLGDLHALLRDTPAPAPEVRP